MSGREKGATGVIATRPLRNLYDAEFSVLRDILFHFIADNLFQPFAAAQMDPQAGEIGEDAVHSNDTGPFPARHTGFHLLLGLLKDAPAPGHDIQCGRSADLIQSLTQEFLLALDRVVRSKERSALSSLVPAPSFGRAVMA